MDNNEVNFCPECGEKYLNNASFCMNCGAPRYKVQSEKEKSQKNDISKNTEREQTISNKKEPNTTKKTGWTCKSCHHEGNTGIKCSKCGKLNPLLIAAITIGIVVMVILAVWLFSMWARNRISTNAEITDSNKKVTEEAGEFVTESISTSGVNNMSIPDEYENMEGVDYLIVLDDFSNETVSNVLKSSKSNEIIEEINCEIIELLTPIKKCTYLRIPIKVEVQEKNYYTDKINWLAAFRDARSGIWILSELYDYEDGQFHDAVFKVDPKQMNVDIDAFTVIPSDDHLGDYSISYALSGSVGFEDKQWAEEFLDRLYGVANNDNENNSGADSISASEYTGSMSDFTIVYFRDAVATSVLDNFIADYAINRDIYYPWVEGVEGDGIGESISMMFKEPETFRILGFQIGYADTQKRFEKNNRPKTVLISFEDGTSFQYTFRDIREEQYIILGEKVTSKSVKVEILDVYPGNECDDTCIYMVRAFND